MPPLGKLKSSLWKLSKEEKVVTCSRLLVKDVEQRPGTWLKLITKTLSKFLWHDANLVRHINFLLCASDTKCQNQQQERLTLCLDLLRQSPEWRLATSLCQKHLTKATLSMLAKYLNLLNSIGNKLERQGGIHGYFSWWLRKSLWQCDRHKLRQTRLEQETPNSSKTGWNNAKWFPSHSMSVPE